jgi:hypothetical protein
MSKDWAQEYRRQAQECLAVARTVSKLEARASLEALAQVFFRLANQQDEATPPAGAAGEAQPIVQQQQQPQPGQEGDGDKE